MGTYLFGNTGELLDPQFDALSGLLDAVTFARVGELGVTDGWRCLEVGGGGGSVAARLAGLVGPNGHVTTTDLEIERLTRLEEQDNVTVLRHDIVNDVLPENAYDLVHARLVLLHLPRREAVLRKLARALRPGGWLLLDEFACTPLHVLTAEPDDAALITRMRDRLFALLEGAGAELDWGDRIEQALRDVGLRDVAGFREIEEWKGGSPGCRLLATTALQTRGKRPVSQAELDRYLELMGDPSVVLSSYAICSAWGRR